MGFFENTINKFRNRVADAFKSDKRKISNTRIAELVGINVDSYNDNALVKLSYLDNYTETLSTRTSSERSSLSSISNSNQNLDTKAKNAVAAAAQKLGQVQNFMACFGAPFSYLEAVDPFGRVYKDTFGLRREEAWNIDGTSLKDANTDTKVYVAYIKAGMVTMSKSRNILKNNVSTSADGNSKDSSLVSSFALSYYVNDNVQVYRVDNRWKKGQCVPFNKFLLNAIARMVTSHTSKKISEDLWGSISNIDIDQNNQENLNSLKNKINKILGDGSYPFFKYICSEETTADDSISNTDGESMVKGLFDKGSSIAREISFVTGGGDAVTALQGLSEKLAPKDQDGNIKKDGIAASIFGSMIPSGLQAMKDGANSVFGEDIVDIVLKGNSIIYPKIWTGSTIVRTISLQIRLYSPYGDWNSVFMNILLPYMVLMGLALPRQTYPSFVSFPFSFSLEVPGLISSEMSMITNLSVRRGGRYDAWSDASFMRGMDITVTVAPLKPLFGFPEETLSGNFAMGDYTIGNNIYGNNEGSDKDGNRYLRKGDITFANELRNLSGSFIVSNSDISDSDKDVLKRAFSMQLNENKSKGDAFSNKSEKDAIKSLNESLKNYNKDWEAQKQAELQQQTTNKK